MTRAVARPSSSSLFLCIPVNKGNHFLIWTFGPRKPLFTHVSYPTGRSWPLLCSISSGSLACTPLASESCPLVYSAALNPIACYQSNFAPSFRSTWHQASSCACQSFARSSCMVSLACDAHLPLRPSLRPTTQSSQRKGFPSFASSAGVSPPSFTKESSPLFDFGISSQPTLPHSLPTPNSHSLSTQVTNIDIDSPAFASHSFSHPRNPQHHPKCKFATPSSCASRESRVW